MSTAIHFGELPSPMTTAAAISRTKQRAQVLEQELLYWATEVGRAEETGAATETQVQAVRSALDLASNELVGLRSVIEREIELADDEAETIVQLDGKLGNLIGEYRALQERTEAIYQPKEHGELPLPTRV